MIASGPGGPLPPIRPGGEVPVAANARLVAGAVSGTQGVAIASVRTETAAAIDPARQTAAAVALPGDETNERARAARGLVEPSRAAASMLTGEAPTESTPAGPPPAFEVSILEKTRAVASASPPVVPPDSPEPRKGGETSETFPESGGRAGVDAMAPAPFGSRPDRSPDTGEPIARKLLSDTERSAREAGPTEAIPQREVPGEDPDGEGGAASAEPRAFRPGA